MTATLKNFLTYDIYMTIILVMYRHPYSTTPVYEWVVINFHPYLRCMGTFVLAVMLLYLLLTTR